MSIQKRYILFFIGIMIQAAGVTLVVKSILGTSPISSLPYVLGVASSYSLGLTTFLVNLVFMLAQFAILGQRFQRIQLLQLPIMIVFSAVIDVYMYIFSALQPEAYGLKLVLLLVGTICIALGVSLQVIADVIMLSGDGFVNAVATRWHFSFGKVKTMFDTILVVLSVITSLVWIGDIEGIREGTLVSAVITGTIARFFIDRLGTIDEYGRLIFAPHFAKRSARPAPRKLVFTDKD